MTRGMTTREKILLAVLVVVVVMLGWFKLLFEPINNKIDNFYSRQASEQSEIQANLPLVQAKKEMEEELEVLRKNDAAKKIPLYDNSKPLLSTLNKVMTVADHYSIDFGEADTDDYIVIHTINLSYTTNNYERARTLINSISEDTFPNQISDVSISMGSGEGGTTSASLTVTFFEVAE